MIRVLVADDHPIVRMGVRRLIEQDDALQLVAEVDSSEEAFRRALEDDVDVLLLDLEMPGRGGLETLREVKRHRPNARVLVLSQHPEDPYAIRTLRAGALGYLNKASIPDCLASAIRTVARGERYLSPGVAQQLATYVADPGSAQPHEALSDREFQVLVAIGQGKTVSQIAGELALSVKTVSTYRSRLLDKIGLENNAQLIRYALDHDLVT